MNNRQKQAEETKRVLIKTAQKLITKYGYDEVKVEDITNACNRGKGTFYHYFKSKEELLEVMSSSHWISFLKDFEKTKNKPVTERLLWYITGFQSIIEEGTIDLNRQWIKYCLDSNDESEGRKTGEAKLQKDITCLEQILNEAIEKGELVNDTPVNKLALVINAEMYGIMLSWSFSNGQIKMTNRKDRLYESIIGYLLNEYIV
ncbi:transcriptional regulator, TetR family [Clostridium sp. DL-VIII]|uniref:TetR/AcrR family transcriptional regulator n=1 Tax=Clostridium sp. DL-VIII TaxID=641107 RepID=UPI00023B00CE|nr:TetR/AcrR family transcriptional regulator [Clostridium sp. DL-VIII]EHI99183.1 transcriptional regulator, TetR family [Clostridium sp. DL-VIII]